MSIKLKALGLGLLAAMAVSALAVMNATAETGGHFVSTVAHTNITGTESGSHVLHFNKEGGAAGERIGCDNDSYTATTTNLTEPSITVTPSWQNCYTTGTPESKFDIDENSCHFVFTIGKKATGHNTAHVVCSKAGDAFVITHPSCEISVPPQTVTGVSYTNENGEVTLTSTVKNIESRYHNGFCIFLGTNHTAEMIGSVTVKGTNTAGEKVHVTATG